MPNDHILVERRSACLSVRGRRLRQRSNVERALHRSARSGATLRDFLGASVTLWRLLFAPAR
jgi:hypothetical protein